MSVLRQHPYFRGLAPDALDQLCRYAKHTVLKRGASLFAKDDPGNSLYVVISGTVKISISSPDGRNAILNFAGPGELFGEMALLDGHPRSADATANTNCEIFVIDRRDFLDFVCSQPTLATKIIELMCARFRWTSDRIVQSRWNRRSRPAGDDSRSLLLGLQVAERQSADRVDQPAGPAAQDRRRWQTGQRAIRIGRFASNEVARPFVLPCARASMVVCRFSASRCGLPRSQSRQDGYLRLLCRPRAC